MIPWRGWISGALLTSPGRFIPLLRTRMERDGLIPVDSHDD